MTTPQRAIALLVPWLFVVLLAGAYAILLWPRVIEGQVLGACFGVFLAIVLASFIVAAVTFSRDVVTGRWPAYD